MRRICVFLRAQKKLFVAQSSADAGFALNGLRPSLCNSLPFGRVQQTGRRTLITTGDGKIGYVNAKNRYGMPAELEVPHGENPIIPFIKFYNKGE